jgi:hypothetical protein
MIGILIRFSHNEFNKNIKTNFIYKKESPFSMIKSIDWNNIPCRQVDGTDGIFEKISKYDNLI